MTSKLTNFELEIAMILERSDLEPPGRLALVLAVVKSQWTMRGQQITAEHQSAIARKVAQILESYQIVAGELNTPVQAMGGLRHHVSQRLCERTLRGIREDAARSIRRTALFD